MSELVQAARLQEYGRVRLDAAVDMLERAESELTQAHVMLRPLVGQQAKLLHQQVMRLADQLQDLLAVARRLPSPEVSEDWVLMPQRLRGAA